MTGVGTPEFAAVIEPGGPGGRDLTVARRAAWILGARAAGRGFKQHALASRSGTSMSRWRCPGGDVPVELLRVPRVRPARRSIVVRALERQHQPRGQVQGRPILVDAPPRIGLVDGSAQQRGVEPGQRRYVGTVLDYALHETGHASSAPGWAPIRADPGLRSAFRLAVARGSPGPAPRPGSTGLEGAVNASVSLGHAPASMPEPPRAGRLGPAIFADFTQLKTIAYRARENTFR